MCATLKQLMGVALALVISMLAVKKAVVTGITVPIVVFVKFLSK